MIRPYSDSESRSKPKRSRKRDEEASLEIGYRIEYPLDKQGQADVKYVPLTAEQALHPHEDDDSRFPRVTPSPFYAFAKSPISSSTPILLTSRSWTPCWGWFVNLIPAWPHSITPRSPSRRALLLSLRSLPPKREARKPTDSHPGVNGFGSQGS